MKTKCSIFIVMISSNARTIASEVVILVLCLSSAVAHAQANLQISGHVYDCKTRNELPGASVQLMTSDSIVIATTMAYGESRNNDDVTKYATYSFTVPKRDAAYILKCSHAGYATSYMSVTVDKLRRRETTRNLPPLLLREEATMLEGVTVSATKVKFYYRGDTVVYNADAFVLSEGSMLDALVRQLPGVELKENGDIYHNGKLVESLLLNGKDFFKSDKSVMLDNLPTYTVKQVEVYDKQGEASEFVGRKLQGDLSYVMDIKLKKEYSIGMLGNIEAGAGVASGSYDGDQPYLGRLFAMRFTDHSRVSLFTNVNDLNDDRQPGKNDSWQPDNMSSGNTSRQKAGLDYSIDARNKKWKLNGSASLSHSRLYDTENTNRTNFLSNSDTYEKIENSIRNKNLSFWHLNEFQTKGKRFQMELKHYLEYKKYDLSNGMESMAYADTVINRYVSNGLNRGNKFYGELVAKSRIKFADVVNDYMEISAGGSVEKVNDETFKRYNLFSGSDKVPSKVSDQYFDNMPNRNHWLFLDARYWLGLNRIIGMTFSYNLSCKRTRKGSRLYLLEQMEDYEEKELGWLPSVAEYESVQDFGNSYNSTLDEVKNKFTPSFGLYKPTKNGYWSSQINMPLEFIRYRMHYMRGRTDTIIRRNTLLPQLNSTYISWTSNDRSKDIDLRYWLNSYSPDLQYMVDICDDTDPLNIRQGNSGLKNSYCHRLRLSGLIELHKKYRYFLALEGSVTDNAIAMGYMYDVNTGVRTYKAYNVDGNWDISLRHNFRMSLNCFTLNVEVAGLHRQNADIIGSSTDGIVNRSVVRREQLDYDIDGNYSVGKNSMSAFFRGWWQYLHSTRPSFTDLHVANFNYGVRGIVNLPFQMQLSTTFTVYSRRGYNESSLNANDLVWDARLSYPLLKGRLVLMVDGFDILGNLSNVTYSVNGQGRTEVRRNVLPQYVLFHAQLKLSKQPKKKR